MTNIELQQISSQLADLLRLIEAGDSIIITHANKPLAELKPIHSTDRAMRPWGLAAGDFQVPADCDQPLPDDIVRDFEGI